MSDKDKLGKVEAVIKNGKYKGKNLEIDIGEGPFDSSIHINDEPVAGVKKVEIVIDAESSRNKINLELYNELQKLESDEAESRKQD